MTILLDAGVAIYVAVWLGVFVFMWRIDKATQALAAQIANREEGAPTPRARVDIKKEVAHE
jgi:CcmD family protein